MSQLLRNKLFNILPNPYSTIFNPHSLAKYFEPKEGINDSKNFVKREGKWVSLHHHSELNAETETELNLLLEEKDRAFKADIATCNFLFITLGTAWVFEYLPTKQVVANCHKLPANLFKNSLMTSIEIQNSLELIILKIKEVNPSCQLFFTISPVRHLRSGLVENSLSKSLLRAAVFEMETKYQVGYFPSFELLIDDLRDYRFYASDMLHPNETALAYISSFFEATFMNESTIELASKAENILKFHKHKPFNNQQDNLDERKRKLDLMQQEWLKQSGLTLEDFKIRMQRVL